MKCQDKNGGRYCDQGINAAIKIWDYMNMGHTLQKSDVILVPGSNDTRTAVLASQLFNKGYADWLLFSGKEGNLTNGKWMQAEALVFRDIAISLHVPKERIIVETCATNTGENMLFSYQILQQKDLHPNKIIIVHTPYMERRSYATFMKQFPGANDIEVSLTSPKLSLMEYPNKEVGSLDDVIGVLIGCLKRIKDYPDKGFQIYQDIPNDVWEAYKELSKLRNTN